MTPVRDGVAQTPRERRRRCPSPRNSSDVDRRRVVHLPGGGHQRQRERLPRLSNAVVPYTVPGAPLAPAAAASSGQAIVSWTAPSDGFSPITGYTVTPSLAGVAKTPQTFASTSLSQVVTGLTVGGSYLPLRAFERVRQIDAADVGTNVNLGQMYLEERKYAEAIAVLKPAAATEPYNVSAAYNLGLALTRNGQAPEGEAELQRAQALRSTGYAVTYGTGYLEQGHYAEAVASTGAEPELVDQAVPPVSFIPSAIGPAAAAGSRPASPFGQTFTAADLAADGARRIAAGLGGGLTLLDADGDGDLDLFVAAPEGQTLLRNDGDAGFVDATAESGLEHAAGGVGAGGAVSAGDYDNDGKTDLFVLRAGGSTLYHNDGGGHFSDVTRHGGTAGVSLPARRRGVCRRRSRRRPRSRHRRSGRRHRVRRSGPGQPHAGVSRTTSRRRRCSLLRNNGNGTFTDITRGGAPRSWRRTRSPSCRPTSTTIATST